MGGLVGGTLYVDVEGWADGLADPVPLLDEEDLG